jgi:transcriptional regulator with GAF, ATPase, and Fis domain
MNARHINEALEKEGGKINGPGEAAEILGIHPNTLRKRMSKLGIPYGRKSWQPYSRG